MFIGLENINPDSLKGASKGQNRITDIARCWKRGIAPKSLPTPGISWAFRTIRPNRLRGTSESFSEIPIDLLEFFILTPLPGSKDHQDLHRQGVPMSSDLNKYDVEHAVTAHPQMTQEQWQSIYDQAWHLYYTPQHIETLLRRAKANGIRTTRLAFTIFYFYASYAFEHVHPLQSGVWRRKHRRQRRSTLPRENIARYFMRRVGDFFKTYPPGLRFLVRIELARRKIEREPDSRSYSDLGLDRSPRPINSLQGRSYRATEFQLVLRPRPRIESPQNK